MRLNAHLALCTLTAGALLSLTDGALGPVAAQSLKEHNCTGKPDVPYEQQISGCSDAIESESFAGKSAAETTDAKIRGANNSAESRLITSALYAPLP